MKKIIIIVAVILAGYASSALCEEGKASERSPFSFLQGFFLGDEYVQYQRNLQKAEEAYRKGDISKEKYTEMKEDAEMEYKVSLERK